MEPFARNNRVRNIATSEIRVPKKDDSSSISSQSVASFVTKDDSLAKLLLHHKIEVRDFVLLSFVSNQGSLSIAQLARAVAIEPETILSCVKRLSAVGLVVREPLDSNSYTESKVTLTSRGEEVSKRVSDQL